MGGAAALAWPIGPTWAAPAPWAVQSATEVFDETVRPGDDLKQYAADVEFNLHGVLDAGPLSTAAVARMAAYAETRSESRIATDFATEDPIRAGFVAVDAWRANGNRNAKHYDRDGDDRVTLAEAVAVAGADRREYWRLRRAHQLLALPELRKDTVTLAMVQRRAAETFAHADVDHDGVISRDEFTAWLKAHPSTDAFGARVRRPVCLLKPPGPDDIVVLVGAAKSERPTASPETVDVDVEPGTQPIYLTLVSTEPVRWRLTGDAGRVAWVNLLTKPLAASTLVGAVPAHVRRFETGEDCVPDPALGPAALKAARADLATLLARAAPRYLAVGEQPVILVPSGLAPPASRRPDTPSDQLTGWWRVRRVGANPVPAALAKQTYAAFGDGRVSGRDGCNAYWGRYVTRDATVAITDLMTTSVRCRYPGDPEATARGGRLFELLDHAKLVRRSGDQITLMASEGESLELFRAPPDDRIQPLWRNPATNVLSEPQWIVSPSDEEIRRNFAFLGRGRSATHALCSVDALGALDDCAVIWPVGDPDRRVWQAVLATVRMYRLSIADTQLARRADASLLMMFEPNHEH